MLARRRDVTANSALRAGGVKTGSKLEQSALIEMRGYTEAGRPLICKSRVLPRSWLANKLESDAVGVKYTTKGLALSGSSVVGVACSGWSVRAWPGKGYRAKVHQLFGSLYSGFPLVSPGFRFPETWKSNTLAPD